MAGVRLSRRKIAAYFAEELVEGRSIIEPLAAYLVESKRTREASLLVRDIEAALADQGVLLADIAVSRDLTEDAEQAITKYLRSATGANAVTLRTSTDPHLLGGVRIETPGRRLDTTLRHRLDQLTASKI